MTTTYTLPEAARELGLTPDGLLDFDQSLRGDWDHEFTRDEIDQLRHVLANTDERGVYSDPAKNLTPAAKRDLAKLQAGEHVDLRFGPFTQLIEAGFIEGTQDDYRLVDDGVQVEAPIGDGDDWLSERLAPLSSEDSLA